MLSTNKQTKNNIIIFNWFYNLTKKKENSEIDYLMLSCYYHLIAIVCTQTRARAQNDTCNTWHHQYIMVMNLHRLWVLTLISVVKINRFDGIWPKLKSITFWPRREAVYPNFNIHDYHDSNVYLYRIVFF